MQRRAFAILPPFVFCKRCRNAEFQYGIVEDGYLRASSNIRRRIARSQAEQLLQAGQFGLLFITPLQPLHRPVSAPLEPSCARVPLQGEPQREQEERRAEQPHADEE